MDKYKKQWNERGFRLRVHLTIVEGCLGPCNIANVVMLIIYGETIWFHSANDEHFIDLLYNYIEEVLKLGSYKSLRY